MGDTKGKERPGAEVNIRFRGVGLPSQSRLRRARIPIPFVPSGHFPLIRGIGPHRGSQVGADVLIRPNNDHCGNGGPLGTAAPTVIARTGKAQTWRSVPQSPLPPPLGEVPSAHTGRRGPTFSPAISSPRPSPPVKTPKSRPSAGRNPPGRPFAGRTSPRRPSKSSRR